MHFLVSSEQSLQAINVDVLKHFLSFSVPKASSGKRHLLKRKIGHSIFASPQSDSF